MNLFRLLLLFLLLPGASSYAGGDARQETEYETSE